LNLSSHWNAGAALFLGTDRFQDLGVWAAAEPTRLSRYAGNGRFTILAQIVDVRFDSRPTRVTPTRYFALGVGVVEGLSGSPTYLLAAPIPRWCPRRIRGRRARLDWNTVSSSGSRSTCRARSAAPTSCAIHRRPLLDRRPGRWSSSSASACCKPTSTRDADWRIDPFIAVGQVYGALDQVFSHPRVTGGVGFRAWVHPTWSAAST